MVRELEAPNAQFGTVGEYTTNVFSSIDAGEDGMVENVACWLDSDFTLYVFIIPVGLVILNNLVVIMVVTYTAYVYRAQHR